MMIPNRRRSALFFFLQTQIDFLGKGRLTLKSLNRIKAMIDNMVLNCCLPQEPPRGSDSLVRTAYTLMKDMNTREDIKRLKVVQTYLANKITCCI